jgi:hypothetical protein
VEVGSAMRGAPQTMLVHLYSAPVTTGVGASSNSSSVQEDVSPVPLDCHSPARLQSGCMSIGHIGGSMSSRSAAPSPAVGAGSLLLPPLTMAVVVPVSPKGLCTGESDRAARMGIGERVHEFGARQRRIHIITVRMRFLLHGEQYDPETHLADVMRPALPAGDKLTYALPTYSP